MSAASSSKTETTRGPSGQLNKTQPVHPKQPRLLNALGFSLPAGQQRARDPRPERPQRALLHARSTLLCSNAVQARHAPATRQSPRIPALEKQRPRRLLPEVAVYQSRPRSSRAAAFGSEGGIRTPDPAVNSRLLCQLSYFGMDGPLWECWPASQASQAALDYFPPGAAGAAFSGGFHFRIRAAFSK